MSSLNHIFQAYPAYQRCRVLSVNKLRGSVSTTIPSFFGRPLIIPFSPLYIYIFRSIYVQISALIAYLGLLQ